MPSQTDLDQGGTPRQWIRSYLGPSVGWQGAPLQNVLSITVAGTYTLDPSTSLVEVNTTGSVTIILPRAADPTVGAQAQPELFVNNPIVVVDIGGNAASSPITIKPSPVGGESIMGSSSLQITISFGGYNLLPIPSIPGWNAVPFFGAASSASVNWINVRNFGAVGNGVVDDTAAINSAIAAFNTATRGVLYFPAGTYLTSSSLTAITASGTICGDGSSDLQTAGAGLVSQINCNSLSAVVFTLQAQQQVVIRDLAIVDTAVGTPLVGSSAIIAGSAAVSNPKVDMINVTVMGFYTCVDRQSGQLWLMDNCFIFGPVLYALRIRNLNNADVGDWCISNCFFYPLAPAGHNATSAIRIESSGGGKIVNSKINGTASFFATGIDIQGTGATLDMQISNCSFEAFSSVGISVNGSWANVTISNCELGAFGPTAVNAISMVNTAAFTIVGITVAGNYSGPIINLSNAANYFIAGITGINWTGALPGATSNKVLDYRDSAGDLVSHFWDVNNGYVITNGTLVAGFATSAFAGDFVSPMNTACAVQIGQAGVVGIRVGLKAGAGGTALLFDDSSNTFTSPAAGVRCAFSFPSNYGFAVPGGGQFLWSSGFDPGGIPDTGLSRATSKVIQFNDGTADANGWANWAGEARVTSDVVISSSTTLANVAGLSVNLQAGRTYSIEAEIFWTDLAAAGIQLSLGGTATVTSLIFDVIAIDNNLLRTFYGGTALGAAALNLATTTSTIGHATIKGTFQVNAAGTLTVMAANGTSTASGTTIKRGSRMLCEDMP
jgi:hypothetical protein